MTRTTSNNKYSYAGEDDEDTARRVHTLVNAAAQDLDIPPQGNSIRGFLRQANRHRQRIAHDAVTVTLDMLIELKYRLACTSRDDRGNRSYYTADLGVAVMVLYDVSADLAEAYFDGKADTIRKRGESNTKNFACIMLVAMAVPYLREFAKAWGIGQRA